MKPLHKEAVELLQKLVSTPSPSREEHLTATIWQQWLSAHCKSEVKRFHNNVYVVAPDFNPSKPILLLNSHHDTVRPVDSYTRNPYDSNIENGKLYGLGSNDAGASGVALAATFINLQNQPLPVNLIFAITAAEEVMGELGMRAFLPYLKEQGLYPNMAIIGEPTGMNAAIAERGLLVFDAVVKGVSGHAARNEGINAIYRAIDDIESLRNYKAPKESDILGPLRISVTMIQAGSQHNVVPDQCRYVVDVRTTDAYSNEDTVILLKKAVKWSELTPRSTRVRASVIKDEHPLVRAAVTLGKETFVSPTTSDMALMYDIPSLKIGPGESSRSHSADEFVLISEIEEAIDFYPKLIKYIN